MYCYLPTLLCRKEDTDLRESVTAAGGAEGRFGPVDRVAMDGLAYGRRGVEVWREGEGAE
jgi:hypothetical protein